MKQNSSQCVSPVLVLLFSHSPKLDVLVFFQNGEGIFFSGIVD